MMRTQSRQLEEMRKDGVKNDPSIKVIQEDFSMRVPNDLTLRDLLEDFSLGGKSNLSWKDLLEDFGARWPRDFINYSRQLGKLDKRNADEDWLEVIDGPLRDISDSSSWWWDAVKKRACDSYRIWVASGPYERNALAGDGRNGSSRDGGEINHEISSITDNPTDYLYSKCDNRYLEEEQMLYLWC
ncbi:hypothetical protein AK812_SmicGene45182 [Symbiodinium microadriaticum]|uniref:Uncharacterized protein n=1 Tax=Symbiodinium microadriaticum TaxID=2951 RepID=A0A1Q9BWR6_SYMMI|nr:hypothetical protein AK812_SmicGene45182 [Symbiodinium microadriaticum]